jgi:ABC-type sugar transport system permease subunit
MYILDVALGAFDISGGAAISVIMMAVVLVLIMAFIAIRNRSAETSNVI